MDTTNFARSAPVRSPDAALNFYKVCTFCCRSVIPAPLRALLLYLFFGVFSEPLTRRWRPARVLGLFVLPAGQFGWLRSRCCRRVCSCCGTIKMCSTKELFNARFTFLPRFLFALRHMCLHRSLRVCGCYSCVCVRVCECSLPQANSVLVTHLCVPAAQIFGLSSATLSRITAENITYTQH